MQKNKKFGLPVIVISPCSTLPVLACSAYTSVKLDRGIKFGIWIANNDRKCKRINHYYSYTSSFGVYDIRFT